MAKRSGTMGMTLHYLHAVALVLRQSSHGRRRRDWVPCFWAVARPSTGVFLVVTTPNDIRCRIYCDFIRPSPATRNVDMTISVLLEMSMPVFLAVAIVQISFVTPDLIVIHLP